MKKVLFVVGSLRQGSFNHQFAQIAEEKLNGKAEVAYLDYSKVPVFSQDLETPVLPEVQAIRDAVAKADVIWFVSPAYNYGIPGPVKNLVDWLSRALDLSDPKGPSILQDKKTTVSIVANGGHDRVADDYRFLLPFVRTSVVEPFTTSTINGSAWADGKLVLEESVLADLDKQVEAVLNA
ncbi:NAD(P)H-dependent oxidoreductase [Carnobacteriaceae bacterium zg-C25]|nr:NAD(P)H-dependent oxidoreductase [Carnobacteriaceae bacterium zg-C25]